jgi:uncharacterized caspase-like protein
MTTVLERNCRRRLSVFFCLCFATLHAAAQDYLFEKQPARLALVLGVETYQTLPQLPSVKVDKQEIAKKLIALGFTVTVAPDLQSMNQLEEEILPAFRRTISEGDIVLFYFSGHGFAYGSSNYIAPANLKTPVQYLDLTNSAAALESIQDYLGKRQPGVLMMMVDACRTIANFVIRGPNNENLVGKGTGDTPSRTSGINTLVGFAAKPGTAALARSQPGRMSPFTEGLVSRLPSPDTEFGVVFKEVSADVLGATGAAQQPGLMDWSLANLYLQPTSTTLASQKVAWESALGTGRFSEIDRFAIRNATSSFAAAARQWVRDHPELADSQQASLVSPAAIERLWGPNSQQFDISWVATGLGFEQRYVEPLSARFNNENFGFVNAGYDIKASARADVYNQLAAYVAHGSAVATTDLVAMVNPSSSAGLTRTISAGSRLVAQSVERRTDGSAWLAATLPGSDDRFYVTALNKPIINIHPGESLLEVVVPPSPDGFEDLLDPRSLQDALARLRSAKRTISWVSIATAKSPNAKTAGARQARANHALYLLKKSGFDEKRTTTLVSAADMTGDGIRVRFFGR